MTKGQADVRTGPSSRHRRFAGTTRFTLRFPARLIQP